MPKYRTISFFIFLEIIWMVFYGSFHLPIRKKFTEQTSRFVDRQLHAIGFFNNIANLMIDLISFFFRDVVGPCFFTKKFAVVLSHVVFFYTVGIVFSVPLPKRFRSDVALQNARLDHSFDRLQVFFVSSVHSHSFQDSVCPKKNTSEDKKDFLWKLNYFIFIFSNKFFREFKPNSGGLLKSILLASILLLSFRLCDLLHQIRRTAFF